MKEFKVMCSNTFATYSAGRFIAESREDAVRQARKAYAESPLGKQMQDAGAFRFYTVSKFPHEERED